MDSGHIGVCPCKNVLVLLERFLDVLSLLGFQKRTNVGEMIVLLRDLDGLQGVCHRGVFIRRVL